MVVTITSLGAPSSSTATFFDQISPPSSSKPPSSLLSAIEAAIRGSPISPTSQVDPHEPARRFQSSIHPSSEDLEAEEELAWNSTTVLITSGGTFRRKYSFANEDQDVQYACTGVLQQPGMVLSNLPSDYAHYTSPVHAGPSQFNDGSERQTFGPFASARAVAFRKSEATHHERTTFIFLRTFGKAYLQGGAEQTFPLPFAVRAAWPLNPHGVLIQRVLDATEIEEASQQGGLSDDFALPTLFTLTDPVAELKAVGMTDGLLGGFPGIPVSLKDEAYHSSRPLRSIPADEHVIHATSGGGGSIDNIIVTVDGARQTFTIWRAAYLKPKDTPVPLKRPKPKTRKRKGPSDEVRKDTPEPTPPPSNAANTGNAAPTTAAGSGAPISRYHSVTSRELADRADRIAPPLSPSIDSPIDLPAPSLPISQLSQLPNMPPSLSSATTLASLATASSLATMASQPAGVPTNELSATMNRMALHARAASQGKMDNILPIPDATLIPPDHGRMSAAYWMEKMHVQPIPEVDRPHWQKISVALFDERNDGKSHRSLLGVCLPVSGALLVFSCTREAVSLNGENATAAKEKGKENENAAPPPTPTPAQPNPNNTALTTIKVTPYRQLTAVQVVDVRATLSGVPDAVCLKSDGTLTLFSSGLTEIPISMDPEKLYNGNLGVGGESSRTRSNKIIRMEKPCHTNLTLVYADNVQLRVSLKLVPTDLLVNTFRAVLCTVLPFDPASALHVAFVKHWSAQGKSGLRSVVWGCLERALFDVLDLEPEIDETPLDSASTGPWEQLSRRSRARVRLLDDVALRGLKVPLNPPPPPHLRFKGEQPSEYIAPVLSMLHVMAEELRLDTTHRTMIIPVVTLICRLAYLVRPEWIDHWKRLFPSIPVEWTLLSHKKNDKPRHFDNRLPRTPDDVMAILSSFTHLAPSRTTKNQQPPQPAPRMPNLGVAGEIHKFNYEPSFLYGAPMHELARNTAMARLAMAAMSSSEGFPRGDTRKRAEQGILGLVQSQQHMPQVQTLPLSTMAPIIEAARTCQLAPPSKWPAAAYTMISRNDLSESLTTVHDPQLERGYRTMKSFCDTPPPRKTIRQIVQATQSLSEKADDVVTGVEMDMNEFLEIRFNSDQRVKEVTRMLCSSIIPNVRMIERPELSEHDLAKEQQILVGKTAERTITAPLGRAMLTFGTLMSIAKEAYSTPKIEYSIRVQPQNVVVTPEPGKVVPETMNWAEFHNGVAAALRISPTSLIVESSWIAFNKPSDLTPQHAGFLLGLGLTGHLREMLTWHTFSYLTPKHDFTSMAVLLGLSAANLGTGNRHVTKLLAVHTPALLPVPNVDLNIPLQTQAAGVMGVGLLYMGTRNRRMAETALTEINRRDLSRPDLSNEYREAYTIAAGIAFGMVMLGQGASSSAHTSPADLALTERLRLLVHGEAPKAYSTRVAQSPGSDLNLTSPAATIALGLMYLKSERQDVANMLTIPDTVLALSHTPPSFLLLRVLARSLIMWNEIQPTQAWLQSQVPSSINKAMEARMQGKTIDDAFELAYYNILAGGCLAMALRYAGTARHEAYMVLIGYFDIFTRLTFANGVAFDHKIKRAALKEGLNAMTLALGMVMAGTGEINCLRRLRYAHGMNVASARYDASMTVNMAMGLLFLGGGKYTLSTSDAAVACMVAAFFPRFPNSSTDTRGHLQALRHLWVLAVEPRCLIARDVDTKEVAYIPIKIKVKEDNANSKQAGYSHLIAPTLIPELDKLLTIRVDTPRYWPFYLDVSQNDENKAALVRNGVIYVKRRSAFLSYLEDPKGSRSLLVRSGSSTGDAATLDFPYRAADVTTPGAHPASELGEFITSFANDTFAMSFADRFCRSDGNTPRERVFHGLAHAMLYDAVLQDKPRNVLTQLQLWITRGVAALSPRDAFWNYALYDLRALTKFYEPLGAYEQHYSGQAENNRRPGMVRGSQLAAAMHDLDAPLEKWTQTTEFKTILKAYVCGRGTPSYDEMREADDASRTSGTRTSDDIPHPGMHRLLAWYLIRYSVPPPSILQGLRFSVYATLYTKSHRTQIDEEANSVERNGRPFFSIEGVLNGESAARDPGVQEAVKAQFEMTSLYTIVWTTATALCGRFSSGPWDIRSLRQIVDIWSNEEFLERSSISG